MNTLKFKNRKFKYKVRKICLTEESNYSCEEYINVTEFYKKKSTGKNKYLFTLEYNIRSPYCSKKRIAKDIKSELKMLKRKKKIKRKKILYIN
jgi:hypothetical protein